MKLFNLDDTDRLVLMSLLMGQARQWWEEHSHHFYPLKFAARIRMTTKRHVSMTELLTLQATFVAEVSTERHEVARELLEELARDIQLRLSLIGKGMPHAEIMHRAGDGEPQRKDIQAGS